MWRDEEESLAAAGWLAVVFVRSCEDNGLLGRVWIAGTGQLVVERATDAETQFHWEGPSRNTGDRLRDAFEELASYPAMAGLVK